MSARTGVVGKVGKLINSVGACGAFGESASLMNGDPKVPLASLQQDESGASSSVFSYTNLANDRALMLFTSSKLE